ncbi:MAG: M16 family metallopeptidase [Mangrovibacterium sp.]
MTTLNRTIAPELQQISKPDYIAPEEILWSNGIKIYATKAGREEMMRIDWTFRAGDYHQNKALVANLTTAMLQLGSTKYSSREIAEIFDFHGAYIHTSCAHHNAVVSLICLKKHLNELLPVLEDLIKNANFPEKEFTNLINRRKQRFSVEMEKVKTICQKEFSKALFGENHPYTLGVKFEDFDQVLLSDLKRFYQDYYHSANCELQLVGQYDQDTLRLLEERFGGNDWSGTASDTKTFEVHSSTEKVIRLSKPDSIQSAIRIGKIFVDRTHSDYFDLKIMTALLGGYFGSRLMSNIREDKGYTYGIGAGYVNNLDASYFLISTEVDKEYELETLKEINFEIERLQTELVGEDELHALKQYLTGEFLRNLDGAFQQLAAFRNLHQFGLDYSHYDRYFNRISSIGAEDIMRVANMHLQLDSLITVIAGKD